MNVEREAKGGQTSDSSQTSAKATPPPVAKSALPASAPTPAAAAPVRQPPALQPATRTANLPQILEQLNTTVARPEKESNYTLSVFFVGAVMVALPLAYLLLVLLVMAVLFFIWPPLAIPVAVIVLVLMLKPLLAPSGRRSVTYSLIPDREPAMFQFVQRLCNAVGAPIPQRIDVSMDANASASFGKGDDLVLTIGLPLCAGLSLRQLAGVMAHEFGHFTQSSAMRLTYVVGHMNSWLVRIVTERDAWDLMLLRAINRGDILTAVAAPIYGVVWLNRMMFYGIVMGGQLVCAHMLRQMEFDADRYESQVAGSATFCETSLKLQPLMQAVNWAFEDLDQAWMEKRLSDNFPAMVIANVAQMEKNPAQVSAIRRAVLQTPTKLLDSHPSPSARIERANLLNAPGILNVDAASSILFADFDELCKGVTAEFYKKELGLKVESWNLVASETVISEQEMHNEAMKTLMRFFQGEIIGAYQIFPPAVSPESTEDPQQTLANLRSARQQMLAGLNQSVEILQRYRHADTWIREMTKAWVILESGFSFDPAQFGLPDANFAQVGHAREAARQDRDLNEQQLASAIQCAQVRMCSALQLLHVPAFAQRFNNVAHEVQRCAELQRTLAVLQQAWPGLKQMRDHTVTLELLLDVASEIGGHNPLYNRLFQECGQVSRTLNEVRWKVSQVAYPFPHAHGHVTIGNYALAVVPPVDEPVQLYEAAHEMHEKLMNLYFRAMSYLAMTAEKVEDALGIDRLPDPFGSTWDPSAPSADITVQQPS